MLYGNIKCDERQCDNLKSLYISRVKIKNYRNFKDIDVMLGHKAVIIGENNVGKTNFLRALQLILDPSLSDEDRYLEETDFNDSIKNPMENGEIICKRRGIDEKRRYVQLQLDTLWDENKRLINPQTFILNLSPALQTIKTELLKEHAKENKKSQFETIDITNENLNDDEIK